MLRSLRAAVLLGITVASPTALAQEDTLAARRDAARASPNDPAAQRALGQALIRAGRYPEAEAVMRRLLRLERGSEAARYEVARVAIARGDHRRAETACRAIGRPTTGSNLAKICFARAALVWRRGSVAMELLEPVLAAEPNNVDALLAIGEAHRMLAAPREAEAAFRRAAASDPSAAAPHHQLGLLYANEQRSTDAVNELRRAVELDGTDPVLLSDFGRVLGATDEAIAVLGRAVAARPNAPEAHLALGLAYLARNDAERAEPELNIALRLAPENADTHVAIGRAAVLRGRYAEAEPSFRRALALVPNSAGAMLGIATVEANTERLEDAFESYRHAADLDPQSPTPLLDAAALAIRIRREVLATAFLGRVTDRWPRNAQALALTGDVRRAQRDHAGARQFYERALAGDGPFDRARVEQALRELPR